MNKKKITLALIVLVASEKLLACPMCLGQDSRDKYYIYIVGVFILMIYFPMFYLFKTFMKYKNINNSAPK